MRSSSPTHSHCLAQRNDLLPQPEVSSSFVTPCQLRRNRTGILGLGLVLVLGMSAHAAELENPKGGTISSSSAKGAALSSEKPRTAGTKGTPKVVTGGSETVTQPVAKLPSWQSLEPAVTAAFVGRDGWKEADLITQSDATRVLSELKNEGWSVRNSEDLLAKVLPDSHPLATSLRSKGGLAFMRKISGNPQVFDKLDRLLALPGGDKTLNTMIRTKDGAKVVDYFQQSATRGAHLTEMLPRGKNGRTPRDPDFEKPTGKLYTAEALVKQLKVLHNKELAQLQAARRKSR